LGDEMFQSSPALEWRLWGAEGEVDVRWWGEASMVSRRRWCCAYLLKCYKNAMKERCGAYISWYICTLRSKLTRSAVYLKEKIKPRVGKEVEKGCGGGGALFHDVGVVARHVGYLHARRLSLPLHDVHLLAHGQQLRTICLQRVFSCRVLLLQHLHQLLSTLVSNKRGATAQLPRT
jgi:hypothetical protein